MTGNPEIREHNRSSVDGGLGNQNLYYPQGTYDAPNQGLEQAFELIAGWRPGTMEAQVSACESVGAVEHQQMQVDVERWAEALDKRNNAGLMRR